MFTTPPLTRCSIALLALSLLAGCASRSTVTARNECIIAGDRILVHVLIRANYSTGAIKTSRDLWQFDCNRSDKICNGMSLTLDNVDRGDAIAFQDLNRLQGAELVSMVGSVATVRWGPLRTFTIDFDRGVVTYTESGQNPLGASTEGRGEARCKVSGATARAEVPEDMCEGGHAEACTRVGLALKKSHLITRAVPILQKACDGNDALGCAELAELAVNGDAGLVEASRWQSLEQRACDLGDGRNCKLLGLQLKFGTTTGIPRANLIAGVDMPEWKPDSATIAKTQALLKRAVEQLQPACEAGDGSSCKELGDIHEQGYEVVVPDFERAVTLYERACGLDGPAMCLSIHSIATSDDRVSADKAIALGEIACSKKYWQSCLFLADALTGKLKSRREEVPKDLPRAEKLRALALELAEADCRASGDDACRTLASNPQSNKARWFEIACNRGAIDLCVVLGDMYLKPNQSGTAMDPAKSREAFARAASLARSYCNAGDVNACNNHLLPLINERGVALEPGDLEAFQVACRNTNDCTPLATLYRLGRVVTQDLEKAQELLRISCLPKQFYSWADYARTCK